MLLQKVNADPTWAAMLEIDADDEQAVAPVMATPSALAAATPTAAKAAGFVVGAGAVTGAAYAAYRTATGSEQIQ